MAEEPTRPSEVVTKDRIKLPLWMWIVVGGIVLGGTVYVYKARKASAAQQAAANATTTPSGPTPAQSLYADPTTILPMFQGTAVNTAPTTTPSPTGPPADVRTVLNTDVFNENGWSATAKQAPWRLIVANPGESWQDITARMYGFADNYAKITDPQSKARVDSVADYIKKTNASFTGTVPDGTGPKPGSVVVYR